MAENKFKIGDTVQLNSGGPEMTVGGYNTDDYAEEERMVNCDWFDDKGLPQFRPFHEDQLSKTDDDENDSHYSEY